MSMSSHLHGVAASGVDVAVHERFASVTLRSEDLDHVVVFPARDGYNIDADLVALAAIGDEIARQARRRAHTRRVARRTAELAEAVAS